VVVVPVIDCVAVEVTWATLVIILPGIDSVTYEVE
jgi:hypothetical protein